MEESVDFESQFSSRTSIFSDHESGLGSGSEGETVENEETVEKGKEREEKRETEGKGKERKGRERKKRQRKKRQRQASPNKTWKGRNKGAKSTPAPRG